MATNTETTSIAINARAKIFMRMVQFTVGTVETRAQLRRLSSVRFARSGTDLVKRPRMTSRSSSTTAFAALGLSSPLTATLADLGYEEPTPVQREAIPLIL